MPRKLVWQLLVLAGLVLLIVVVGILSVSTSLLVGHRQTSRHIETRPMPTDTAVWTTPTPITRFAAMNPDLVQAQYEGRLLPDGTIVPVAWLPPVGMYIPQEGFRSLTAPTVTPTPTPSNTPLPTDTPTLTATVSPTATTSPTNTLIPTVTVTETASPTMTLSPLPPTVTLIFLSATPTPSISPTPLTPTSTYTASSTPTSTTTFTPSATFTPTSTFTDTPTATLTQTPTPTATVDRTQTAAALRGTAIAYEEVPSFLGCAPQGFPVAGVLKKLFSADHRGVDLGVYVGTAVDATHSGVITYADWSEIGYGYLVVVQSGAYSTYYAHLSDITVDVGQQVSFGQIIALSGNTGNSSGPHLHYEVRVNGIEIDPFVFETLPATRC